jgi:hypothetical protein
MNLFKTGKFLTTTDPTLQLGWLPRTILREHRFSASGARVSSIGHDEKERDSGSTDIFVDSTDIMRRAESMLEQIAFQFAEQYGSVRPTIDQKFQFRLTLPLFRSLQIRGTKPGFGKLTSRAASFSLPIDGGIKNARLSARFLVALGGYFARSRFINETAAPSSKGRVLRARRPRARYCSLLLLW